MTMHQQGPRRRMEVLQLLRDTGTPMGAAEIADRLEIHVNTARFHLDTLLSNGRVERTSAERGTPGRPPQLFRAVQGMDPMGPRRYRMLAEVLAASVVTPTSPGRPPIEAGRSWGRQHAADTDTDTAEGGEAVGQLLRMLDDLGFAPEQAASDGAQIGLRNCPFLELAVSRPEVVCPIHLGLMQGAMEAWDADLTVDRLDAFVEPDMCVAHLAAVGAA